MCKNFRNMIAGLTAGVMLLSSVSCSMIDIRDSETEAETAESIPLMLAPAQRTNEMETREETEAPVPEEPAAQVTFCFTGDILVDQAIIQDAANRAPEGKSYGFIRMYTGVFQQLKNADFAAGFYSAADVPVGSDGGQHTPVESLAALADIGYDVLDTTCAANDSEQSADYGIMDIAPDVSVQYAEQNGLDVAFLSVNSAEISEVRKACEASDLAVVFVNWENGITAEEQQNIGRELARAGADVIIGDGDVLGAVEWIETGDNTPALIAYSLGNLLATSDDPTELCGGMLELTAEETDDGMKITQAVLSPTVVRYTEGYRDYQLILLSDYKEDLSRDHAVAGVNAETLLPYVRETVTTEFLIPALRG